jgi:glycosyltransferase involved in cell wall biosynthesis
MKSREYAQVEKPSGVLVSVVVPCFNSGATINQTLDSIRAQTWTNIEVIVVDDGSDEVATQQVLNALTDVTVLRQKNKGLPAARNSGISIANGKYVMPLDADDWLEPQAIAVMLNELLANSAASFVYSYIRLEGEAEGVLEKNYNFFEQLFLNQMPYCLLMPKNLWSDVGGYDETMRRGYEDWEFSIRMGVSGKFGLVVPEPLFHYRVSRTGMLLSKSSSLHGELWADIQSKHRSAYRLPQLWNSWRKWRVYQSSYPLLVYFFWIGMHKIIPPVFFKTIFQLLKNYSQSKKATRNARCG